MPELNLKLNFLRSINSVWQDYRGLGTLDGMAHAANLVHTSYIAILDIFFSQNLLRYTYIHGTHLIGGIALFYLVLKLLKNKNAALLASLFYMLNLGTSQMYFAPLEVFATHFAALPIIALAIYNAISKKTKLSLLILAIASFLTSPQGFVPTVFIAYSLFIASILFFSFKRVGFKRIFLIALILFTTNAFWMLPFSYSTINKSNEIKNTRINEFSSEEIYYRNHARGTIQDVLTFKGFMLDTIEYDTFESKTVYFMEEWRNLQENNYVKIFSWLAAFSAIFGIFITLKYRIKNLYPIALAYLISFLFLANNAPVLSQLNEAIRNILPLFGEAFRFPFTKFITLFAFTFSILFGLGVSFLLKIIIDIGRSILERINFASINVKNKSLKISYSILIFVISLGILAQALPSFNGNFTSPLLRLEIPNEYQKTTEYFKNEDKNGRILTLPMSTFWNWQYRTWGHRGSGFMWYGIPQPMVERAFDPWSLYNEQLFNEISYAQTQNDIKTFDALLAKYDINYILLDKSVLNTLSSKPIDYDALEAFLSLSEKLTLDKKMGKISIYKAKLPNESIYTFTSLPSIDLPFSQSSKDLQLNMLNNYIVDENNPNIIFPFPSLSTLKLEDDTDFVWKKVKDKLVFTSKKAINNAQNYNLQIPNMYEKEFYIPISVSIENNSIYLRTLNPEIFINGKKIEHSSDPIIIYPQVVMNPTTISFLDTNHTVGFSPNSKSYLINNLINTVKLSDGINEEYVQIDTHLMPKTPKRISLPSKITTFEVSVPLFESPFSGTNIVKNKYYKINKDSDFNSLMSIKSSSDAKIITDGVRLAAISDTISLDYYMADVFHQGTYVVIADTKYEKGLPVNFYVDSPLISKSELETKFKKGNKTSLVIMPPTDDYQRGYGFHFSVKSIGGENASSVIREVNIYPITADSITNIMLIGKNEDNLQNISNPKKTEYFTQIGNFLYSGKSGENPIIALSQSYDKGWKAYEIENNNKLKEFLPFIFGKEIKTHSKINNWANGWKIDQSSIVNHKSSIIIVYLPQYLQFGGFFLLILTFLLFPLTYFKYPISVFRKIDDFFERKSAVLKHKIYLANL